MGRHKRLNAVRKSGKAQAEDQLIDSSKAVNQNNYNISQKCAQSRGGMKIYYVEVSLFLLKFHAF